MARRSTPPTPQRPIKTIAEKRKDIDRLQRRIDELEAFDPAAATRRHTDPAVMALETNISSTLETVFGHATPEFRRYSHASRLDNGPISMGGTWGRGHEPDFRPYLAEGREIALATLRQAVRAIEEDIEFAEPEEAAMASAAEPAAQLSRRVFVVHGHDDGAKETVARYLTTIGFDPVILHEQANKGMTVLEKIEANGDVGFAVVLLTPDDEGAKRGENPVPRARQNVLLELGYFIGRIGRDRVCALRRGDADIPSDFAGVLYETMDDAGAWKTVLARELQAAGHEIDWNRFMRPA